MIKGTQVLWSTVTYVPIILLTGLLLSVLQPFAEPYLHQDKPITGTPLYVILAFVIIATPLCLRYLVWRPLRDLAQACDNPRLFRSHCIRTVYNALPYTPLMALPIALLCLNIGGWFFWCQLGAIVVIDHYIEKWREKPIRESVDDLLSQA